MQEFQRLLKEHPIQSLEILTGITFSEFQQQLILSTAPRVCVLAPRQSGKSTCLSCLAFVAMMQGKQVCTLQPSVRQSSGLCDKVRAMLFSLAIPLEICSRTEITLPGGGSISAKPIRSSSRGATCDLVLLDELSWIEEIVEDDVLSIALPFLSKPGSRLIVSSSPRGRRGLFYRLWHEDNDFHKIMGDISEVKHYDPDYLASQLKMLGSTLYGREFLNRFDELNEISLFSELDIQKFTGELCLKNTETMNDSCSGIAGSTSQPAKAKTTLHFV
jgi:hypothetical protein